MVLQPPTGRIRQWTNMLLERTDQINVKRLFGSAKGRFPDGQTPLLYGNPALHQLAELVLKDLWQYDNGRCLPC